MNKEYASNFFEYLNKLYEFNKLNNLKPVPVE